MINIGKYKILKNYITACDYDFVLKEIEERKKTLLISPIASYTLTLVCFDSNLNKILKKFDHLVPDGQWVKYAIRFLYGKPLKRRVYGPELMLRVCDIAKLGKENIFLYGTNAKTLSKLRLRLIKQYPGIKIVGSEPSVFRQLSDLELKALAKRIESKKTNVLFIALGSPLQERFAVDLIEFLNVKQKVAILTVGAAFDFVSGIKPQAPALMRNTGMEWLFRLIKEPRRLWIRYLVFGPLFLVFVVVQKGKLILFSEYKNSRRNN